ncbi:DUF3822 family protein [Antarcticibacterium arcticum]|uniref:DUF3822 family protein n=1 Tax=Antarcticibacterium arcticum TaxID=2585771 RepID=A0A5B8YJ01_9FLAO|nr:DUF3822 family protein [Antarcticibacterium arcticum]QED36817.1 DUF3822 family protein [Antarcticibacterium arcticum]
MDKQQNSKENIDNLKMSIQVRLNGLSFCILDSNKNEVLWYKKLDFEKELTPVKILEQIELLYKEEKQLDLAFSEVVLLFSNELYSIVPSEFFVEEEASHYLKFNTKILQTDLVANDVFSNEDLVNVYIPYTNITNYFFDKYGEFEFKHSATALIEHLNQITRDNGAVAYLNGFKGYYDLVVMKDGKLLLGNTFKYETPEDFIYYLLFTAEQLQLDPLEFPLYLLGEITKDSPEYEITYTYIKNVEFLDPKLKLIPEKFTNPQFQREAFILLKSLGCE